jgi:hypothetical protein
LVIIVNTPLDIVNPLRFHIDLAENYYYYIIIEGTSRNFLTKLVEVSRPSPVHQKEPRKVWWDSPIKRSDLESISDNVEILLHLFQVDGLMLLLFFQLTTHRITNMFF